LGTLLIYDHRDPIFIRSLILFDRIVIPIPENRFGTLTSDELKNFNRNAKKLEDSNAAVIYTWNRNEFQQWETETMRDAFTPGKTDKLYHTPMHAKIDGLKKQAGVEHVSAAPVYKPRKDFNDSYSKISLGFNNNLSIIFSQLITVPDIDKDHYLLDKIIELRGEESFKTAMIALPDWQNEIPDVIAGEDPPKENFKSKRKI